MHRLSLLLALLFLASAAPAAHAAPAVDGISARAVDADGKSIGRAYFVEERNPGSKFVGHIAISNSGKTFARLYVDAVDAVTSNRGGTVFAPRDADDKSVGAWITPSKKLIRLDPGDTKTVSFTVDIPEDARPGDHVGGVAIEPLRRKTTGGQFAVTQVLRVAIATQIKIRGETTRELVPTVRKLEAIPGSEIPALTIQLANNGDLLCKPTLTATLYQDDQVLSSEKRNVDTILARTAIDYPLYWPRGLSEGTYTAAVRTEGCGKAMETQAEVKLDRTLSGTTPPARTGPVPEPPGEPMPTWLIIAIAVLAALLLLAAGFWLARLAARRERERERRDERDRGGTSD
ncbi:MAG: DUF916 domain-containing protein [Solirubrobacteraceae bacterium]|nr:DUF916 domain-containing protein [Solirubrobacteraceae bacterium]